MTMAMRRFGSVSITVQIAAVMVLSAAAIHLIFTLFFYFEGPPKTLDKLAPRSGELAALIRLIDVTPPDERTPLMRRLAASNPQFALTLNPAAPPDSGPDKPQAAPVGFLKLALGDGFTVREVPTENPTEREAFTAYVTLNDGSLVRATFVDRGPPGIWGPLSATLIFLVLNIVIVGVWVVRMLTAPLRALARSAERFGGEHAAEPVAETGPYEVRKAAAAFNRMQNRITRLVDNRTRMLAAVSHDLRTPITRLRLRAEFIEDPEQRDKTLVELDQMSDLVERALAHLRDGHSSEEPALIDLPSLLQTVCDHFSDLGTEIPFEGPDTLLIRGRPSEIQRAVQNLVENAIRYAVEVSVRLDGHVKGKAIISVADHGPGIPPERRAELMEPFARGDEARTMEPGNGFGLGLAIARTIAEAHHGTLELAENTPHGLVARITLPLWIND